MEVLRLAWTYLLEHQGKGTSYWAYLEGYADMAFQRALMTQPKESAVTQKLLEVWKCIIYTVHLTLCDILPINVNDRLEFVNVVRQ